MDAYEIVRIIKKFGVFILAALIIALAVWWLWVRKTSPSVPPAGSGARVMSEQEVQDALRELSVPGSGATKPMTSQEIQRALESLGAPSK